MNEQLQSKLVEILSSIQATTKAAGDFAMEQLPEIAQTYVLYGRVQALLDLMISIVAVVVGVLVLRGVAAHVKKAGDFLDAEPLVTIFGGVGGTVATLLGVLWAKSAAASLALVWFAPKVWLLKELAGLVK